MRDGPIGRPGQVRHIGFTVLLEDESCAAHDPDCRRGQPARARRSRADGRLPRRRRGPARTAGSAARGGLALVSDATRAGIGPARLRERGRAAGGGGGSRVAAAAAAGRSRTPPGGGAAWPTRRAPSISTSSRWTTSCATRPTRSCRIRGHMNVASCSLPWPTWRRTGSIRGSTARSWICWRQFARRTDAFSGCFLGSICLL